MRQGLMCPRRDRRRDESETMPVIGVDFDLPACIDRTCGDCKGVSKLEICEEELAVTRKVKYIKRLKIHYETMKGEKKEKHDLVSKQEPIADFLVHMEARLKDLAPHHCDMVWQRKDWVHVQKNFPKGSWIYVCDYSENLTLEVKNEHQSKYCSQVPVTLYGVVATFWIADVRESYLPPDVTTRLKAELKAAGKPEQINVTFAHVSDDTRHNQAFVQHCHLLTQEAVCKTILKKKPTACYARSDGAPTQFANATQHYFIGLHNHTTRCCPLDWSIHCSCHGKDRVDPEMGLLKNMIRRHLLTETIENITEVPSLPPLLLHSTPRLNQHRNSTHVNALFFVLLCNSKVRIQDYEGARKKLVELGADKPNDGVPTAGGVYRREIVSVPAIGLGSPRQNIPRGIGIGASKDRQFTDQNCGPENLPYKKETAQHSIVRMRRRSCHFCKCCMRLDPTDNANQGDNGCEYGDICGPANNVVKVPKEKSKTSRITRSQSGVAEHLAMVQKAKEGSLVAAHSKTEPEAWFLGVVTKTAYKPNVTFKGPRGERVHRRRVAFGSAQAGGRGYGPKLLRRDPRLRWPYARASKSSCCG
jgi:hypothetical protein